MKKTIIAMCIGFSLSGCVTLPLPEPYDKEITAPPIALTVNLAVYGSEASVSDRSQSTPVLLPISLPQPTTAVPKTITKYIDKPKTSCTPLQKLMKMQRLEVDLYNVSDPPEQARLVMDLIQWYESVNELLVEASADVNCEQ